MIFFNETPIGRNARVAGIDRQNRRWTLVNLCFQENCVTNPTNCLGGRDFGRGAASVGCMPPVIRLARHGRNLNGQAFTIE
jgi:hypothetical protein